MIKEVIIAPYIYTIEGINEGVFEGVNDGVRQAK